MSASDTPGLLLINLGTTSSPSPGDVRRYLREFLSDPRVIDGPAWKRKLIVELFILPTRPRSSGEAYAKIWTEQGSTRIYRTDQDDEADGLTAANDSDADHVVIRTNGTELEVEAFEGGQPFSVGACQPACQ